MAKNVFHILIDSIAGFSASDLGVQTQEAKDASRESLKRISDVSGATIRLAIIWFIVDQLFDSRGEPIGFIMYAFFGVLGLLLTFRLFAFTYLHLLPNVQDPAPASERSTRGLFRRAIESFSNLCFVLMAALIAFIVPFYLVFYGQELLQ